MLPNKYYLLAALLFLGVTARSQTDSSSVQKPEVSLSGFVDVYYVYDFNKPQADFRQPFLYNHNRHNEFNLNLGFIRISADHARYRANLALQTGTYAADNYAAEPAILQHIFEANAGVALNRQSNLWLDAGIFGSHIGFESAISLNNWTLTRSLLAENSPYFLTGAKLTYNPDQRWEMAALVINGWQRIRRIPGNPLPSFGTQVNYHPQEKLTLNWSTFIGTDDPDTIRRMRYFNNFYVQYQLTQKFGFISGFDLGLQQETKGSADYVVWYSPVVILRYAFTDRWATSLRGEYYRDPKGVIISSTTPNGFKTTGVSLNFDYFPVKNVACRLEGRWFNSAGRILEKENKLVNDNFFISSSIAVSF